MPVLSGSFPVRRYSVVGTLDAPFWERIQEGLTVNAFSEPPNPSWAGTRTGTVTVDNLLVTDFADRNWLADPYVFASLRIDTKSPSAAVVRAETDRRVSAWRSEHKAAHVPRDVRKQLKDQATEDVLAKTSARTKVVDFVWNTKDNWVTLGHLSDGVADHFTRTFRAAFGLGLENWSPFGQEVPAEMPGDFYLWLWWQIENGEDLGVDAVWIDGKIVLKGRGSETTVTGDQVEKMPEPRSAVLNGKRPTMLKLKVGLEELEYAFTLSGPDLHISSLRLPEAEAGRSGRIDREANILDRLGAYERLHDLLAGWAKTFGGFYNTKAYHEWVTAELTPWLNPKE